MPTEEQKKANTKMGLVLLSIVLVLFVGFMLKMWLLSH